MKINLLLLSAFIAILQSAQAGPGEGKSIFIARCASCHHVNQTLTGPPLKGVEQRRSLEWITRFVQSSQTQIKKGDKDAVAVFQQFNGVIMPDQSDLSAGDIRNIVAYIKEEAARLPENHDPFARPYKKQPSYRPLSIQKDGHLLLLYMFAVAMLTGMLYFMVCFVDFRQSYGGNKKSYS